MAYSEKDIVARLEKIVGSGFVLTKENELQKYGSDQSFVAPCNPICAALPRSLEEVHQIVLMANELSVPVIPYSSGTSLQGAHIPARPGITVDLSRMNKIHAIDPVSRNAIIEPGVTFAELQKEAKKQGLRVLTPIGIPAHASVVATYAEFTPLYSWPKYGPWETLTVELVLPTGDIMGTGQMAIKRAEHPYTWSTPFTVVNRMFFGAQGTLGIITKAAITLKTLYEVNRVFFVEFDDVTALAEAARKFLHSEVTEEMFAVNAHYLAAHLAKTFPDEFAAIKSKAAPWTLVMLARGYEEEVEMKTLDLQDAAAALNVTLKKETAGIPDAAARILQEIACPRGSSQHNRYKRAWNPIFCFTTKGNLSPFITRIADLAKKYNYAAADVGYFIMPLNHGGTFYFEPGFYRNPQDKAESDSVKKLFIATSEELIDRGAFFDRPYPLWAEKVYARAATYHDKIKELKAAVDPKNIMHPGRLAL